MNDFHSPRRALSSRDARLLRTILEGRSDANIRFAEIRRLLRNMGFRERVRGSHHIFDMARIRGSLVLQPRNSMAKTYQVQQVRTLVIREGLIPR